MESSRKTRSNKTFSPYSSCEFDLAAAIAGTLSAEQARVAAERAARAVAEEQARALAAEQVRALHGLTAGEDASVKMQATAALTEEASPPLALNGPSRKRARDTLDLAEAVSDVETEEEDARSGGESVEHLGSRKERQKARKKLWKTAKREQKRPRTASGVPLPTAHMAKAHTASIPRVLPVDVASDVHGSA
ncbi:hypothetical protein FA95DRAFT_1611722 [Auriscalpium vulgare]|uniref:Uncharacterized protein n=1 Tax=Auriscalpium vulgare TaxID=40419 RepID=A0ACB8R8W2_9AGAM|nr:hypothetical protein FA95DRAFT_1611722 [Auriscalpium vulgare]